MANYRKRVLQDAMAALEEETEKDNVKEGAHLRISNLLKRAYNNSDESKGRHIEEYLTEQLIIWPHTIEFLTPEVSNTTARDPNFLTGLVTAKRASSATRTINDWWWNDLMAGLLEKSVFDLGDQHSAARHDLYRLAQFCNQCPDALGHLENRLDRMGAPQPYELFPCGPLEREHREDGHEIDECELPDVWDMLARLPRFIGWLLRPNSGLTIHGYDDQEVARLKQFAFVWGTGGLITDELGDDETRDCRDEGWLRVLGLRDWTDITVCEKLIQEGWTFAEAYEFVKNKTPMELSDWEDLASFSQK